MADQRTRVPAGPELSDFEAVFDMAGGLEQERWERAAARVRFEGCWSLAAAMSPLVSLRL
ncbi:hypothetical protein ACFYWX_46790 [Streptomyces sp. NPDC002888]|uniref:hypothetical protein n=1 Tax=Streptomyces sp. NPDC002888 TaxID=3364668 RepID=UPI0036963478